MINILKDDGKVTKKIIVAKALGNKAIEDKVNVLNNHYKGQIVFKVEQDYNDNSSKNIVIDSIDNTLDVLEIPYVEELSLRSIPLFYRDKLDDVELMLRRNNLKVVKLPRELKEFIVGYNESRWLKQVNRLFLWDTTYLDISNLDLSFNSELEMIIIQSTKGGRAKVFRF